MGELLATLRNIGVLGVPGVPDAISITYSDKCGVPAGVPGVPEHRQEHPEHRVEHRSTLSNALIILQEHREHPEHWREGVPAQDCPHTWIAALDRVDIATSPEGVCADYWRQLVEDARWLAEQHGEDAAALGWTASDLFGVDVRHRGWGGVADRIDGARKVTFTDRNVVWRWNRDEWGSLIRIARNGRLALRIDRPLIWEAR